MKKINLKNLTWEDGIAVVIILLFVFAQILLLSQFKQMPSPLFGGDYWYQHGHVAHIKAGGNLLKSSAILNGVPHYMPFYAIMVGLPLRIINIPVFTGMEIFSVLTTIAALALMYCFGKYFFKNKTLSLLLVALAFPLITFPIFKYTMFASTLLFPAFIFSIYYFYEKRNLLSIILAGIILGLLGLAQMVGFAVAMIVLGVLAIYIVFFEPGEAEKNKEDNPRGDESKESASKKISKKHEFYFSLPNFLKSVGIFALGFLISLFYWAIPIFVYHGKSLTPLLAFDFDKISGFFPQIAFVLNFFKTLFLSFPSLFAGFFSVLSILCLIMFFFIKGDKKRKKFITLLLVSTLITFLHLIITEPLFGITIPAGNAYLFVVPLVFSLLIVFGLNAVLKNFAKKMTKDQARGDFLAKIIVLCIVVLMLLFNILQYAAYIKTDRWIATGKNSLPPYMSEMQDWVEKNTNVNDVFASNIELGFALNSLTGRKTVGYRLSHTGMFVNASKNQMDDVLLLYSNSSETIKKILIERKVKYLYWDANWISLEFTIDEKGQITNTFDPFLIFDTPENEQLLKDNGVNYRKDYTWIDPASRDPRFPKYNVIMIFPSRSSYETPWSESLDQYLEEVWSYKNGNQTISRIYKINLDKGAVE